MCTDMESVSFQRPACKWQVLSLVLLCGWVSGQIRYSVVEESEVGTVVGNVARDLGLKVEELPGHRLRLGSEESLRHFAVHLDSGALVVSQQLDRERLCGASASCVLSVQVVTENPLQLFRLEVEILDLNDNSPNFPTGHLTLRVAESTTVAARFPLESAQDPDVGTNAVGSYWLSPNSHFSLDVKQQQDGKLFPELVLERALDREEQPELQLVLTAADGGSPARLGTAQITVLVLDVNDNAPTFDRTMYKVQVPENMPVGALLLQLNASDPDEGPNGETQYSFGVHTSDSVRRLFALDPRSGEVWVSGALDFEESAFYEIYMRAHDGGVPEMEGHCVLQVEVEDANDNPPEVLLTFLLNPILEDTPPETVVGLFNVRDRDSGANGDLSLDISPNVPFAIRSLQNHFSLVTQESLDRESTSQYVVELVAQDGGSPTLTTTLTLLLNISDVNDNPPRFLQPSYDAFILENNLPGSLLCTVSASDPDDGDNSRLIYFIESSQVQGAPTSSFVHINPDNGNLYAQRTFDFELLQVLPVSVAVRDSGSPPLHANVTVHIFVLDQNDHPPTILQPASDSDVPALQRVPLSAPLGYLVTKVTAVDADAGHNAWLSYQLLPQSTDPSLFHVSLYTGEVRVARALQDTDVAAQQLIVQVTDNGNPPLSTTVTITVALEEVTLEETYKPRDFLAGAKEKPDLTIYLIIALAAVSTVALATITLLAARCLRRRGRAAASPCCCCWLTESPSRDFFKHPSPKLQLSSDGTLKYMEVTLRPTDSQSQCYSTCFSPGSDRSDFTFLRPCLPPATLPKETGAFLSATGTLRDPGQVRAARQPPRVAIGAGVAVLGKERGDWRSGAALGTNGEAAARSRGVPRPRRTASAPNNEWERRTLSAAPERGRHRSPAAHPARMPRAGKAGRSLGLPRVFSFCLFLHSSSAQIRYSIPEELTRGTFVGNIAKDLGTDVAKLAAANLQVLSDSDSQYFSVNVNTGVIMVSERIDREQLCGQNSRCFLHLKLAIENPVEFYRIEVEILDINDNPPEFPSDEVSLRIYELASLGARFPIQPAQDPDVGTNTLQTYHLSANENFNLNVKVRTDGGKFPELVLERALDRELRAFHHLVLTAEDGGSPPQSSQTRITIQVLDANDNHPVFDRPSYGARLVENSPLGTLVVKLNATDVDEGPNGEIRYSLSSHNSATLRQIFAIDEQTGEIRVHGNLDFEEATVYEIEVEAKDMGSPMMEEHCSVVVEITDVNDNAPEVILTSFSSSLSEDAPPGTVVAVIHVRDRDSGEQGKVQCHVSPDLPFQLRKDYEHQYSLLTSTHLDREHVAYYNVTVSASDLGSPPLSRHTVLPITLADVNDNTPQFEQASYEVLVAENNPVGSMLVTVSAADPDLEQNSRLSYSILHIGGTDPGLDPTRYLSIHPTNGQVSAKFPFDYEQTTYLQFHVEVSDGGSPALRNRTLVHIFIVDQNDNAPRVHFPRAGEDSATQFRISPSTVPPALITKVVAIDADSGRNAWLSYHLVEATDPGLFSMALRSGEIRITRGLQETDASAHELLVVVWDAGEPPLSTAVTLVVLVEEKGPEALQGSAARATDGGGLPTITLYLIISLVLISTVLLVALAALGVQCLRRGSAPADHGCCVESVNTLQPPPSHIFGHLHYEPQQGDTVVGVQVMATAPPAPRYRSCFSPVSDISEFMFVKPSAGPAGANPPDPTLCSELWRRLPPCATRSDPTGARGFRRGGGSRGRQQGRGGGGGCAEPPPLRSALLRSDTRHGMFGGRSLPWQLPLLLAALSCLPARSSAQLRYSVPEDREPGSSVGDLTKDLGVEVRSLAARNLRLVSEGGQRHFQVDLAAGVLLLNSRLDREALCRQSPTCFLHLQLVMENPLQLHRVEVDVLDVNDNAPQFPKLEVVLEITEVANPGTRLPLEVAEDPDMGSNSISTYELSPSEHFTLSINVRGDGIKMPEIILEKALDREKVAVHHLTLTALDGGNPMKSGTAKVTIHVLDANDNPPICDPPISKVLLEENVPVGTLVTKLNVTDLDEGPNGDVEYSFKTSNNIPGKFTKMFSLDPWTGEIRTEGLLDYEESSAYEIVVRARDKGSPAMEGHCHLRVELIDINDNSPEIVLTSLSSPVQEDATPGTVIALIGVKDSDSGANGQVRLQIAKELPFKLVSSFKEHFSLVTNGPLDREKASGYNITVRAVDSGSPQRTTQKTFYLQIADVNDNAPNFSSPFDTAHIQENSLPGTSVFSVSASDPDEGSNAKLSYSILHNGMQDVPISTYFQIDQDNGTIYTMRALDYEQDKVFQVPVEVKDAGSPALSSTAVVHVFILDENDNAPTIVYPSIPKGSAFHQTIPALAEPGYLVTKIVAVDADSGHNAWLSYQLQETAEALPFQVERHSGEIRVAQAFRELEDPHRLVVEVRDNGTPSLSASVVIVISPEENSVQDFAKSLDLPKSSPKDTNLTLYLIISLVSISLVFCVMFAVVAARCLKAGAASWTFAGCCRGTGRKPASHFCGQMKPDGFIEYLDVGGAGLTSQAQNYTSCFSPMSDQNDFLFVKPFSHSSTVETMAAYEQVTSTLASPCDGNMLIVQTEIIQDQFAFIFKGKNGGIKTLLFPLQQAQPNTDWRFSQTQRPGTSG
ncbi:hypothetical protein QYF61_027833 [Mycteria americana]|uniref:Protocadherin gamma-C3 n=1 Tax=Mycteria americana TaxID=33587 RepID=A0AAN7MWA2_MYCAM|nr:hypothetical protein QYF61_027833 [Mycteria americana]